MFYQMYLEKEKTAFWDEDVYGDCTFHAENDREAQGFVATVVARMNHKYEKIGEPRNVTIIGLVRLEGKGFEMTYIPIDIDHISPFPDFSKIRKVLNAFYPKNHNGRRTESMMHMFSNWEPLRKRA